MGSARNVRELAEIGVGHAVAAVGPDNEGAVAGGGDADEVAEVAELGAFFVEGGLAPVAGLGGDAEGGAEGGSFVGRMDPIEVDEGAGGAFAGAAVGEGLGTVGTAGGSIHWVLLGFPVSDV